VFDAKNVIGVYKASGSAYDDGYLATAEGQVVLNRLKTPDV
jgi:hypothetical protein